MLYTGPEGCFFEDFFVGGTVGLGIGIRGWGSIFRRFAQDDFLGDDFEVMSR